MDKKIIDFFNSENLDIPTIGILDIGAMITDDTSIKEYQPLIDHGIAKVVGFEPSIIECNKLNSQLSQENISFLPYFIGNGKSKYFYNNKFNMTSSLFKRNKFLLKLFRHLLEVTEPINKEKIKTTKIDEIKEIDFDVDLIKIDIQGAELQAFKGAKKILKKVVVIQTEVCWVPLYIDQPLFSEIELELRKKKFFLHKLIGFGTQPFKSFNNSYSSQHLWSDAIFVKDFTLLNELSERQLSAYIIIMFEIYKSYDFVSYIFSILGLKKNKDLNAKYLKWLSQNVNNTNK